MSLHTNFYSINLNFKLRLLLFNSENGFITRTIKWQESFRAQNDISHNAGSNLTAARISCITIQSSILLAKTFPILCNKLQYDGNKTKPVSSNIKDYIKLLRNMQLA